MCTNLKTGTTSISLGPTMTIADRIGACSNLNLKALLENVTCDAVMSAFASPENAKKQPEKPKTASWKPARIAQSGPVTRVIWEDGEQTVVKLCPEDRAQDSVYVAFCIALAKRLYGTNSALHRAVDTHTEAYLNEQKAKEKAERRAKQLCEEEKRHYNKVRALAKRMRLEKEAFDLFMKGEEANLL